mmetsp:Transcript_6332/g.16185  ORF Transcript_6332/g.16185 Transcript_6332/m.16185 type:complete len:170 (-) Transcript_6332:317-826(-)
MVVLFFFAAVGFNVRCLPANVRCLPALRPCRHLTGRTTVIVAAAAGDDEPSRDWDGALRNLTVASGNLTALEDEPTYRVASSRERLVEQKKDFVDTMNEREERLVNTWGSEAGLLGALGVTGLILCFYIYVGLSGGLDTPRPDIRVDDPVMNLSEDKLQGNEEFLRSFQ